MEIVDETYSEERLGAAPKVTAALGGVVGLVIAAGFVAVLVVCFGAVLGFLAGMALDGVRKAATHRHGDESEDEREHERVTTG